MKKTAKILALLCALLMIVPIIVSCGNSSGEGEATTPGGDVTSDVNGSDKPTETETTPWGDLKINDNIPSDVNYEGADVNILISSAEQYAREWVTETDEPDDLETAIFKRNAQVQSTLGVTLNFIPNTEADDGMASLITREYKSQQQKIHIISNYAAYAASRDVLPCYMNLYGPQFVHMDLSKGYWNQNFMAAAEAYGKCFVAVGDTNLSVYDRCHVAFFNKAKASQYLGDYDELYQMVLDGDWTYDVFYELIAGLHEDNGTAADTSDDFYGVASIIGSEFCDGFLYSFGASLTQDDGNGNHVLVTDGNYTKLSNAFDKTEAFWADPGTVTISGSGNNYDFFTQGHALFDIDIVYHYESGLQRLKDMEDGFGVLPLPKLDTDQEEYYTGVQDAHRVTSVMFNATYDYEMISAVLERFNSISYETVRPFYINKIVKGQILDANSSEVFGIVIDGARWDFADVYASSTGRIRNLIWRGPLQTLIKKPGSTDFSSAYAGNESAIGEALISMNELLDEIQ